MKKINFVIVLSFVFLTACASPENGSTAENSSSSESLQTASTDTGSRKLDGNAPAAQVSLNQAEQTQTAPTAVERKIIRNADLQLEANAPEEAQAKISQIAESKGGFVVESTQSSSNNKTTQLDTIAMTIRVPAAKFDEALTEIRQAASRVVVESIKGQDVTEEFIDIEARLRAQKALEAQFLEIMKRSNTVADALNVQTEIARVRGEIEKIEGRKRFLESQASLSTVKIKLQTPTAFSANSTGFFYQLRDAISRGFDGAMSFILVLVTILIALLPFLILIVLPIYLLIRYLLNKNRKRKLADELKRAGDIRTE